MRYATRNLTIWEDPPNLRPGLCITLGLLGFSSISILCLGIMVYFDNGHFTWHHPVDLSLPKSSGLHNVTSESFDPEICHDAKHTIELCAAANGSDFGGYKDLSIGLQDIAYFLLVTGIVDTAGCFFAILGVFIENSYVIFISLFFIPVALTLNWKLIDIALFVETPYHELAKDDLRDSFKVLYNLNNSNSFSRIYNYFMLKYECCGIRGPEDAMFSETHFISVGEMSYLYEQPPACCMKRAIGSPEMVTSVVDGKCWALSGQQWLVNSKGCYYEVFHHLQESFGSHFFAIVGSIIVLESLQFLLTAIVLMKREDVPPISTQPSRESFPSQDKLSKSKSKLQNFQSQSDLVVDELHATVSERERLYAFDKEKRSITSGKSAVTIESSTSIN